MRAFIAPLALLIGATPALADTLIDNVVGWTPTADGGSERFEALLIDEDGQVEKLFKNGDKRPKKIDYLYDGKGRPMVPGFVDGHAQMIELGFAALALDLSRTTSLSEAQAKIARYGADNPGKPWVLGRGWKIGEWSNGTFPTAADLDMAISDRPVWLVSEEGDAGWANSAALAAAGIGPGTKAPPGGRIEGTGVFIGPAMALIENVVPRPRAKDRDAALAKAQDILLGNGVTTVTAMGIDIEDWQSLRRAGDGGRLQMRVVGYADSIADMMLIGGSSPTPWLYEDRLRMVGAHFQLDGNLTSRGSWLLAPYADSANLMGEPRLSSAQMRNNMSRAAMDGFQVAVSATGDAALRETLDGIAELRPSFTGDRRWRIEALGVSTPDELQRAGEYGAVTTLLPAHPDRRAALSAQRLGQGRSVTFDDLTILAGSDISIGMGSGAPITISPNPLAAIAFAETRRSAAGATLDFNDFRLDIPQERQVDRAKLLRAFTLGAAFNAQADQKIGSLEPGKQADFLLLDADPLAAPSADLEKIEVMESWIGGKQVYRRQGGTVSR